MKILVTGGMGYLGNILIPELLKKHHVTCVDNLFFNQKINAELIKKNNFLFLKEDVNNKKFMNSIVKNYDAIIPLAAIVGAPLSNKLKKLTKFTNLESVKNLCKNLSKDQLIIMPVTNSGYGVGKADSLCDEKSPLNPMSIYGKTKVDAEKIVMDRENSISFRLATVFGPSFRMRTDLLVNNFTYIAYKKKYLELFEPKFRRNYIHINDVANGFIFGLENFRKLKGQVYNLGLSSANLTKEQLCKKIQKLVNGFTYKIIYGKKDEDQRDYFVSNKKIEKKGFIARQSLEKGIKQLLKLYSQKNFKKSTNFPF